ncbi:MAG: CBS domain-containing protein [bacterium]|nr:CBS domain-containing protein [bacterium]
MKTIDELLARKGECPIHSVTPEDTVLTAVERMVEHNVGAMLVLEETTIVGIITERDYLRITTVEGRRSHNTPVKELMSHKVLYVTPETELEQVMALMTEKRIRHVPVLTEGRLKGIVSIGDVVKQIAKDQKVQINTLEAYINDAYPGPSSRNAFG